MDVEAVAEALVRLGCLAESFPQIAEMDVNPLRVGASGVVAVDARVVLQEAERRA